MRPGWVVSATHPARDCCSLDLALCAVLGWAGCGEDGVGAHAGSGMLPCQHVDTQMCDELAPTHLSFPPRPPLLLCLSCDAAA